MQGYRNVRLLPHLRGDSFLPLASVRKNGLNGLSCLIIGLLTGKLKEVIDFPIDYPGFGLFFAFLTSAIEVLGLVAPSKASVVSAPDKVAGTSLFPLWLVPGFV